MMGFLFFRFILGNVLRSLQIIKGKAFIYANSHVEEFNSNLGGGGKRPGKRQNFLLMFTHTTELYNEI